MISVSFFHKAVSYFYPIKIKRISSLQNSILDLYLYRNEWMLTTPEAIYSHGIYYTPFSIPFSKLKSELANVNSFLLLGAGLGSAVQLLAKRYSLYPKATLVEIDWEIIHLAKQILSKDITNTIQWINKDVRDYFESETEQFDLIGIDIFKDMFVPHQFTTIDFLKKCHLKLKPNGIVIMNYVNHKTHEAQDLENNLFRVFTQVEKIEHKQNMFFICKNY